MGLFNPLVSIVIPVYNGANYVAEAIESALKQTYKNIEIIVVNDGSTDNTEKIVKKYGDKIRYFYKENGGVASALNLGIKNMKGEYFSWLLHDDVYYSNKIERQIEELKKLENKDTIIYSNIEYIDKKGKSLTQTEFEYIENPKLLNFYIFPIMFGKILNSTFLIPKECIIESNYFNENLKYTYNYDLYYKISKKSNIIFISNILVKVRDYKDKDYKKLRDLHSYEIKSLYKNILENITDKELNEIGLSKYGLYAYLYRIFISYKKDSEIYNEIISYIKEYLDSNKNYLDVSNIKVSIVVPFYNRINYLLETIDSIKKQTHKNWELILINDGSTEDIDKVKQLCDDKIILYDNSYGKGVSSARNLGMDIADGAYLAFLDSDDLFEENKIEEQLKYMILTGIDCCYTNYVQFYDTSDKKESILYYNDNYCNIFILTRVSFTTIMISKNIYINKYYRFKKEFNVGEDTCLLLNISQNYIIFYFDRNLTLVRRNSTSSYRDFKKLLIAHINIIYYIYYDLKLDINSKFIRYFYNTLTSDLVLVCKLFSIRISKDYFYLIITILKIKITLKIKIKDFFINNFERLY